MSAGGTQYLNIDEAAQYLRLSRSWLYQLVHHGKISHFKFGRRVLFRQAELDAWAEAQRPAPKVASLSRFREVQARVRSLTTERTTPSSQPRKGVG